MIRFPIRFPKVPLSCLTLLVLTSSCGRHSGKTRSDVLEAWNRANAPDVFSQTYERVFAALPLKGTTQVEPWSDSYWPSHEGGVAARWNAGGTALEANAWSARLHSRSELKSMSSDAIGRLSPAEKYDILRGDYGYALANFERQSHSPEDDTWWGICHGWAPAAILFQEPGPVVLRNGDGIEIPFGASDVKALLSFHQARSGRSLILGERCDSDLASVPSASDTAACRDTNPGSFHLVLTNEIGRRKKAFVMDVTRDVEVWNQPVHSFQSRKASERPASPGSAPGTAIEYEIITDVSYVVEVRAAWERHVGTTGNAKKYARYRYFLEVDARGAIVGGSWISTDRPDFLWTTTPAKFTGFFARLKDLYLASVANAPTPFSSPTAVPTSMATASPVVTPVPVAPRPAPSVAPSASVTPVVTLAPTAAPTATPPFHDAPCPAGSRLDAAMGFCVAKVDGFGDVAIGNFTIAMAEKCERQGGGEPCREEQAYTLSDGSLVFYQRWGLAFARSLRGNGKCALGAEMDSTSGACIERGRGVDGRTLDFAYGPFSDDRVSACLAQGGGSPCRSLRWSAAFLFSLVRSAR